MTDPSNRMEIWPADGEVGGVPPIGNDVVDLMDPRSQGQSGKPRFIHRVFTEEEAAWIRADPDPDRMLWKLWAAKETAFKVVTKALGTPPIFEHRAFLVLPDPEGTGHWGRVQWENHSVTLHLDSDPSGWIHMVGWATDLSAIDPLDRGALHRSVEIHGDDPRIPADVPSPTGQPEDWADFLSTWFTSKEADPIHSVPSALVRLEARAAAARALGQDEGSLELICGEGPKGRRPPRLLVGGIPAPLDVSLSHHGRFVAWVLGPRS